MKDENKLEIVIFINTASILVLKEEPNLDYHQSMEISTLAIRFMNTYYEYV